MFSFLVDFQSLIFLRSKIWPPQNVIAVNRHKNKAPGSVQVILLDAFYCRDQRKNSAKAIKMENLDYLKVG